MQCIQVCCRGHQYTLNKNAFVWAVQIAAVNSTQLTGALPRRPNSPPISCVSILFAHASSETACAHEVVQVQLQL